jgi:hypothetical protein
MQISSDELTTCLENSFSSFFTTCDKMLPTYLKKWIISLKPIVLSLFS